MGSAHEPGHGRGLLAMSFSALGVIYGDIGTSPLYSYQAVFTGPPSQQEVLSAASLFVWTLTLIVLVKYVGVILRFDDNGEGGTFALYSLICRAAGFSPFGPARPVDLHFKRAAAAAASRLPPALAAGRWWSLQAPGAGGELRRWYRRSRGAQVALLVIVMVATAMVVGDGVLTPSISVMSAISGLQVATTALSQEAVVGITIAVLVALFSIQRLGTGRVSLVFAPVITVWLLFNAGLGVYNLSRHGWGVWQALNPAHAIAAFTGPKGFEGGWHLLAGVMLCITGAEAMYADLGHFNAAAVTVSFCCFVYPCLVVTYMGQAAYLVGNPSAYVDPFWMSVPKPAFWPMLVVATLASVVASQALISGVFSIMRQAMALGVLPRLDVTHTDEAVEGQIYIGAVNWALLLGCIGMVAGFQDTTAMGHAYGVAVISVMFITTWLSAIVMLVCCSINPALVALYVLIFVPLEGLFLSSNAIKIPEGGWVTLLIAALIASLMAVWWYGSSQKTQWLLAQAAAGSKLLGELPAVDDDTSGAHEGDGPGPGGADGGGGAGAGAPAARRLASQSARYEQPGRGAAAEGATCPPKPIVASSVPFGGAAGGGRALPRSLTSGTAHNGGNSGWAGGSALRSSATFDGLPITRLPGLGIVYAQATTGMPITLAHLMRNCPALPRVVVILTLRFIPLPYVTDAERYLVRGSRTMPGVYRVASRYGYMEAVDHGPAFVRQLVGCLARHVASDGAGGGPGAVVGAGGGGARSVVIEMPSAAGRGAQGGGGGIGKGAGRGGGAGAASQPGSQRDLAEWASVAADAEDEALVTEAAEEQQLSPCGLERVASLLRRSHRPGEHAGDDAKASGPAGGAVAGAGAGGCGCGQPGGERRPLGRESVTRSEYRRMHSRRSPVGEAARSITLGSAGWASGKGGKGAAAAAAAAVASADAAGQQLRARAAAVEAAGGGREGRAAAGRAALDEIGLLLDCYRQRAVYIVGGTRLVRKPGGSRNPLRALALKAYSILAANTQPAVLAWSIPDDQLVELTLTMRL